MTKQKQTVKLSDKLARDALVPPSGELILWDTEVKGFGLRLRSSGGKSWFLKRGDNRWSLGQVADRKVSEARVEAMGIVAEIAAGRIPGRKPKPQRPRVANLMEVYLSEHCAAHCDESTRKDYRSTIDRHIIPQLGTKYVDELVPLDIDKMMSALSGTPAAANKALALLSAAIAKGMRWGIRNPGLGNPCVGTVTFKSEPHEEYLEEWELKILVDCLLEVATERNRFYSTSCLLLLAVTGCRRDELRLLEWNWIDWDRSKISWPDTKTGQGHLILNGLAIGVLERIRDRDQDGLKPHVFCGLNPDIPLPQKTLYSTWYAVKKMAAARGVDPERMKRLRPHDLRHSFATLALSKGMTLDDVGRLLRHKNKKTTARYARHLPSKEIQLATQTMEFLPVSTFSS